MLTDREQVAITMLQGRADIVRAGEDVQVEFICEALGFADAFLAIARDEEGNDDGGPDGTV